MATTKPRHALLPDTSAYTQINRMAMDHSVTELTCTTQVGRDRALYGSAASAPPPNATGPPPAAMAAARAAAPPPAAS
jgi:hypothetical protein